MANDLFQQLNLRDNVSRNSFSLSHNVKFTAKVGELLPIVHFTSMPTDVGNISHNHFTRTAPVQTAAYTRIKEYFDWFFVPYRLLWKDLPYVLSKNTRNPQTALSALSKKNIGDIIPQLHHGYLYANNGNHASYEYGILERLGQETNQFGLNRGILAGKLLSYLGYGSVKQADLTEMVTSSASHKPFRNVGMVSILPILAYQSIYYFWFRNTQWEENQPQNYNVDWMSSSNYTWHVSTNEHVSFWSNPTMFDLQYANYPKDLFFGILPNRQMGDEAEVEVYGVNFDSNKGDNQVKVQASSQDVRVGNNVQASSNDSTSIGKTILGDNATSLPNGVNLYANLNSSSWVKGFEGAFSILELRRQQAIQKYAEILGTGDNNYKSILEKLFNADVSDKLNDMPIYLGGTSSEIKISEVENTNLSGDNEVTLKGKGIGNGKGSIKFNNKDEYGVVMCIYHAQPVVDYDLNALHFDVTKINSDDYALPIFDNLGFVELPINHVDISSGIDFNTIPFLGYTIRNYDYKTMVDRSLGGFREAELKTWYSPVDFEYLRDYVDNSGRFSGINSSFFKVNPHIVDDIFVVGNSEDPIGYSGVDTDQLRINANFQISVVRPLSKHGVPYAG